MKPNTNFNLGVDDINMIESALNLYLKEQLRRCDEQVGTTTIYEIDKEIKKITDLLGRIHNQKNWYRPKKSTYISG